MKLVYEISGNMKEYLALVDEKTIRKATGFLVLCKKFNVNSDIFFDLAYHLERGILCGRAFIDSEKDVRLQMKQVAISLSELLMREVRNFGYFPAATWEGSSDYERYFRRPDNKGLNGLSGFIESCYR